MLTSDYHPPVKRSVMIAGHATSISLEPIFWRALEEQARGTGIAISTLIAKIDSDRLAADPIPNLTSAIRQWLLVNARGRGAGEPGS